MDPLTGDLADDVFDPVPAVDAPRYVVMHHPVGRPAEKERKTMAAILKATAGQPRVVLSPNLDPGREGIMQAITQAGVTPVSHLPRPAFTAMLNKAEVIIGNSSAGLIEAAVLKTPCVNVGPRQNGREKPMNVIDTGETQTAIKTALKQALGLDLSKAKHPYGDGQTGPRVVKSLAALDLNKLPLSKQNTY